MSETINDGGPAFPTDHGKNVVDGMTLRDYFAAHAPEPPHDFMRTEAEYGDTLAYQVRWSWEYADAMLNAREVK